MSYQIREYSDFDKQSIIDLFFEFGHYLSDLDKDDLALVIVPDNYGEKFYEELNKNINKNDGVIYVLEIEDKVVGFIAGVIFEVGKEENEFDCVPHRMGRITDLFISKNYRKQGYGTKLMDKMETHFKEKGCFKVNIDVFGSNSDAFKFYTKRNFKVRNYDVVKTL